MAGSYYDVLEVSPTASAEVIGGAYKMLARKYHPDVYAGSAEEAHRRMGEINAAYETLSDPERRRAYDVGLRRNAPAEPEKPPGAQTRQQAPPPKAPPPEQPRQSRPGCLSRLATLAVFIYQTVTLYGKLPADAAVFCAQYNAQGQLLGAEELSVRTPLRLSEGMASARLFLTDGAGKPLSAGATF